LFVVRQTLAVVIPELVRDFAHMTIAKFGSGCGVVLKA
jgi:hypothetical protein